MKTQEQVVLCDEGRAYIWRAEQALSEFLCFNRFNPWAREFDRTLPREWYEFYEALAGLGVALRCLSEIADQDVSPGAVQEVQTIRKLRDEINKVRSTVTEFLLNNVSYGWLEEVFQHYDAAAQKWSKPVPEIVPSGGRQ